MTETELIAAKPRAYGLFLLIMAFPLIALYSRAQTTSNRQKRYNVARVE
jgi:hypothetical protein